MEIIKFETLENEVVKNFDHFKKLKYFIVKLQDDETEVETKNFKEEK